MAESANHKRRAAAVSGLSRLVLVQDAECELQISTAIVSFANWEAAQERDLLQTICISLQVQDEETSAQDHAALCLPLVVTAPFTQRFTLSGPACLANPLMPLLQAGRPLEFQASFHRPSVSESDFAWDDFQDQVVIQTRLCKLVVRLEAIKSESMSRNGQNFFPRQLPEVKAPSFKLFDHIERNQQLNASTAERRALVVSESFHGDKRKSEALAPLDPGSRTRPATEALPPISTSRPSSGSSSAPIVSSTAKSSAVSTDVNSDREAKAVILKMRARNRYQTLPDHAVLGSETAQPFPESVRLDSNAQAELEHFHHLVSSAMEGVVRDATSGKNQLEYYKQFLPTPSSSDALPVAAAAAVPAKPGLTQLEPGNAGATTAATRIIPSLSLQSSSAPRVSKLPVKLPTLMPSERLNELLSIAENNQETSPTKVPHPNDRISTRKLSSMNNKPQTLTRDIKTRKAATPSPPLVSKPSKPLSLPNNSSRMTKQKPRPAPKNAAKASSSKSQKALEPEQGLSDFDDSDPEVDAAPVLPDDLGGMMTMEDDGDMAVY